MYYVAKVNEEICSQKNCHLCTQYCPETNCINYSEKLKTAYISVDRCKSCEICVGICRDIAKNDCIEMVYIENLNQGFRMSKAGVQKETAAA